MSNDCQELVDLDEMNDSQILVDKIDDLQEPVDKWVVEIEGQLENPDILLRASTDGNIEKYPSIFGNWQSWDDFGASFIPKTSKWRLVACMTHWFGLNLKSYFEYMQGKVDRAWSHYLGVHEKFHTAENNKRFIEHLLVSSCFLILLMIYMTDNEGYKEVILDEIANKTSFPRRLTDTDFEILFSFSQDLYKIELYMITMNYQSVCTEFVLEAVCTEFSNIGNLLDIPIHKFALTCLPRFPRMHPSKVDDGTVPEGGFKHLLHIFHWSRTLNGKYIPNSANKVNGHFHIPSVTELQLSQTVFVKNAGGSIDVCYYDNRRVSGVMQLQLTPLHLLDYSTQLYESLLIFENRSEFIFEMTFTAYVACMACFLKTESDVRVLRENGVIPGTSFDDKDVLHFVQKMKTFISDNIHMSDELVFLEKKVMAHHNKSVYRLIGEFKKHYCSNTWIIISVITGILLFALTFIQTIYGTLSYYKQ